MQNGRILFPSGFFSSQSYDFFATMKLPGYSAIKLFINVNVTVSSQVGVFATAIHYHPSIIIAWKATSLPLEWSPVMGLHSGRLQSFLHILD
jgi:hypothetical protein